MKSAWWMVTPNRLRRGVEYADDSKKSRTYTQIQQSGICERTFGDWSSEESGPL